MLRLCLKFCRKTCWKEQPFIFTVYLMNHIFQTPVFLRPDNGKYNGPNWLCKHIKKVRSSHPAILVLNWIKHSFSLWVSLKYYTFQISTIIKEENDSFAKMKYYHISIMIWDPSHICLAVNNDMQQLSSWNVLAERNFPWKKRIKL